VILGVYGFSAAWTTRQDRRIAENPHWVLLSSWWEVITGSGVISLTDHFPADDLADFEPIGVQPPSPVSIVRQVASGLGRRAAVTPPTNVLPVVPQHGAC